MKKILPQENCPCGSGRKHADCCQGRAESAARAHALDRASFEALEGFAATLEPDPVRLGMKSVETAADIDEDRLSIIMPWITHHFAVDGSTVRDRFLAAAQGEEEVRRWLAAQAAAWMSVWEVQSVDPGLRMTLLDRLTGAERVVYEQAGTDEILPQVTILARVVDFEGVSVLCGVHPHPLMRFGAERVVEEARERLGILDADKLRDPDNTLVLLRMWEDEVREALTRPLPPLYNDDGEEVVIVAQRWKHDDRDRVLEKLTRLPNVEVDQDALSIHLHFVDPSAPLETASEVDDPFALLNRLGQTVAFASLTAHRLELTANSRERAERLAADIEKACQGLLTPLGREVSTLEEMQSR
jgi:hypothetical protein